MGTNCRYYYTKDMKTITELFQKLDTLGIVTTTVEHGPFFTVADAKESRKDDRGVHCKNLFLKDKKNNFYLIVCAEDRAIDTKKLRKLIGSDHLSFGKPNKLAKILGVVPGSVTPFGLINDEKKEVQLVLDEELIKEGLLHFHPLVNSKTTAINSVDFLRFIESCGHKPNIINLEYNGIC